MPEIDPDTDEAREDLQFILDQSWPSSGIPAACDRIRSALERLVAERDGAWDDMREYNIRVEERAKAAEEKVARNAEHISEVVVLERERRVAAEVRAEQLAAELRIREESQIPVIPRAAQERLVAAEAERDRLAARAEQLEAALQGMVACYDALVEAEHRDAQTGLRLVSESAMYVSLVTFAEFVETAARAAVAGDPDA